MNIYKISDKLLRLKNRHFVMLDTIIFLLTPFLSLVLRLDELASFERYKLGLIIATVSFLIIKFSIFTSFNFYKHYWRYASIEELLEIAFLTGVAAIAETILLIVINYLAEYTVIPLSLPLLDGILSLLLVGGIRFSVRAVDRSRNRKKRYYRRDRALVVGAGDSGATIVKEMQRNPKLGFTPVGFIDDDSSKWGLEISGLTVLGNRFQIPEIVASRNVRQVVIAMPTASGKVVREIVDMCQAIGVRTVTLPGLNEILDYQASTKTIRDVKIEDLLRRAPIQTDSQSVVNFIKGKTVLVTGGGGSIGSELCRQIFRCHPATIILMGHGENSIFNIQQELQQVVQILQQEAKGQKQPPRIIPFIGDMRFKSRLKYAFNNYRPDIVFHAAAHKHVPLMELNPPEAISNNVLGTKNLLDLAVEYKVKNFVMISTDKAVNPTNVMGASKRTAEMLVLQAAQKTGRPYVVVRFGNVLGSRGSVVPTFQKQIAKGGPVTITHPEITRYFMTIPEAVQLVLQASVLSSADQIFMLNMGEPVKIVDLAKDLIRLSGYEVGKDIEIVFTGLRPGEKLYEELLIAGEEYQPTAHNKLLVVKNAAQIVPKKLDVTLEILQQAVQNNDTRLIIFLLEQLVAGYKPQDREQLNTEEQSELKAIARRLERSLVWDRLATPIPLSQLEEQLPSALARQELKLHYQPIIELATGEIKEFEALLRWEHPQLGMIYPLKFLSLAEETGVIVPIAGWIIQEVCQQLQVWQTTFPQEKSRSISINIPSRQLLQLSLVRLIQENLERFQVRPQNLKLEISEFLVRENPHAAMDVIPRLRALGIELQIDNFGSTSHVYGNLPSQSLYKEFNWIKIDRHLVSRIDRDRESLEIVNGLITQAMESGWQMVATGVETAEQLSKLEKMSCRYGQGYLFCQPLELSGIEKLLHQQSIAN